MTNYQSVKQIKGFTLVELIVVIVVLGILSVVAAPKFMDLSKDANESMTKGTVAALNSAAQNGTFSLANKR